MAARGSSEAGGAHATDIEASGSADVPGASLDDRELMTACLEGNRSAFDAIVERHQRAVYLACYRFVGNHADASDLTQDTFLRAYRALGKFKGQSALGTWLYRIAVNLCLNRVSGAKTGFEALEPDRHIDTRTEAPDTPVLRDEQTRAVQAAIARLPRKQRATVILRVYHEMTNEEVSRVLGSSVGAVKANFFHALNNLKRLIQRGPGR